MALHIMAVVGVLLLALARAGDGQMVGVGAGPYRIPIAGAAGRVAAETVPVPHERELLHALSAPSNALRLGSENKTTAALSRAPDPAISANTTQRRQLQVR